jgi:hypothetical protein
VRGTPLVVLVAVSCGRAGFDPLPPRDAAVVDPDASLAHVQLASGWTATLLVDLTGIVPYQPNDFSDGSNETLDNAPLSVATLYAPFAASLAVSAGRDVIELASDGTPTVHDYRPAAPDTTGPDQCAHLAFGTTPDVGSVLWIGASSQGSGDGLYRVDPSSWAITRDATNNNLNGVAWDSTGAYDSIGTPSIYFVDQSYLYRRDGSGSATPIIAQADTMDTLVVSASEIYVENYLETDELDRVDTGTHELSTVTTGAAFSVVEEGAPSAPTAIAIRDTSVLASFASDGSEQDIAASTDPEWVWQSASAPQSPHPLAGGFVVLESNRTLDRDDLVYVAPVP